MGNCKAQLRSKTTETCMHNMQNGPAYCEAFLNVLRNVTKEEAVQYVLALIDDMLSGMLIACHCALHHRQSTA